MMAVRLCCFEEFAAVLSPKEAGNLHVAIVLVANFAFARAAGGCCHAAPGLEAFISFLDDASAQGCLAGA